MSLAQAVYHLQSLPPTTQSGAFSAHAASATAVGASQFRGDAELKRNNPNAICVTYGTADSFGELCQNAYTQQTMGDNDCSYNQSYLVPMTSSNIPSDGVIRECGKSLNPRDVCVPKGTVAIGCNPDQMNVGLNVGGGSFQLEPSFIAVPKSTVNLIAEQYASCYGPKLEDSNKKYAYVKTSAHVALSEGIRPPIPLNM
jgi:hypothetical protein